MFGKRKTQSSLNVLVGTRSSEALAALGRLSRNWEVREGITTDVAYRMLEGCHLAVIDLDELLERELSREGLARVLADSGIPWASPQEFASDPELWESTALAAHGSLEHLPCRCLGITSYSGGVGKTTLALDTALHFARTARLPVLVVEFGYGASAFRTVADPSLPSVYDCVSGGKAPGQWRGVDLLPMSWELARLVPIQAFSDWLGQARRSHVLTLVDVQYPHALLPAAEPHVDEWLIFATSRPDTVSNAVELSGRLKPSRVVLNQKSWADQLALHGFHHDLEIPFEPHADRLGGRLGRRLLSAIYPNARFERGGRR